MTRKVRDLELQVFKPSNTSSTPDITVPGEDILNATVRRRFQSLIDGGSFTINNTGGVYTDRGYGEGGYGETVYGGQGAITTGDKLVFRTQLAGEGSLSDRWTAVSRVPSYTSGPGQRTISLQANDFVTQILNWRYAFNTFEDTAISGSSDAILETLLTNNAPEIGQGQIQSVNTTTDQFINGRKLLPVLKDLLAKGDAIAYNDGEDLVFKPLSGVTTKFALQRGNGGDIGTYTVTGADDELVNEVRVEGGTDTKVDDEQLTRDAYTTVTNSTRVTHQLDVRKSEVAFVIIHTRTTGSGEGITVRLQKDEGGSPVAVGDPESDIDKARLPASDLRSDGQTTFFFSGKKLPDPDPWLIIESTGPTGQDIGINNSTSEPFYKAYFPYPLNVRTSDQSSIDEYRLREARIRDDSLDTLTASQDEAQATLRHQMAPRRTIDPNATSLRMHNLIPGEAVDVDFAEENVSGSFIATERVDTYQGTTLNTKFTLQELSSL